MGALLQERPSWRRERSIPPIFESEFCRLFHALIDGRMTTAQIMLTESRDREELDREPLDPWKLIAELFNSESFKPDALNELCDVIKATYIPDIDPSIASYPDRASCTLSENWGQFRSAYTRVRRNFSASGRKYPDMCPNFAWNAGGVEYRSVTLLSLVLSIREIY
jgi:hypothetical protein